MRKLLLSTLRRIAKPEMSGSESPSLGYYTANDDAEETELRAFVQYEINLASAHDVFQKNCPFYYFAVTVSCVFQVVGVDHT